MTNPLSNLKIDYWYKALLVVGACVLLVSLSVEMKGIKNSVVQLISLGAICIGFGEWINHPFQAAIGIGYKISGYPRKNKLGGNLFDLLGLFMILGGFAKLIR